MTEAIEQAFELSKGTVNVLEESTDGWISHRFSSRFACNKCGTEFVEPTPHLFSFNSPLGACTNCQGYGRIIGIDMEKVIPNRGLRLDELPIAPWNSPGYEDCYEDLEKAAKKYGCDSMCRSISSRRPSGTCSTTAARSGTASKASSNGWRRRSTRSTSA